MTHKPNQPQPSENADGANPGRDPVVSERVQELSWALLDDQISADEMQLLDNLLLSDDEARRAYINCVQLHTDLAYHFHAPAAPAAPRTGKSLILGFLNESTPGVEMQSPPSEDFAT